MQKILVLVYLMTNMFACLEFLTTDKYTSYSEVIDKLNIPPKSTVLANRFFWLGLHKNHKFISLESLAYGGEVEYFMRENKVEYAILTCHSFNDIVEGYGNIEKIGELRSYLATNGTKIADFLYDNYYKEIPKEEKYYPPSGVSFNNSGEEYYKSIKIYQM